ncbi:hypothetical protein FALCPG4_005087 [Fusarium falciforme]
MFRAKGSTRAVGGRPQRLRPDAEEAGSSAEAQRDSEEVPFVEDERTWIRWPVSLFVVLIYRPIWKPFCAVLSSPASLLLVLVLFLFAAVPFMIISGFLSAVFGLRSVQGFTREEGKAAMQGRATEIAAPIY